MKISHQIETELINIAIKATIRQASNDPILYIMFIGFVALIVTIVLQKVW